jgi:hypothetical protein
VALLAAVGLAGCGADDLTTAGGGARTDGGERGVPRSAEGIGSSGGSAGEVSGGSSAGRATGYGVGSSGAPLGGDASSAGASESTGDSSSTEGSSSAGDSSSTGDSTSNGSISSAGGSSSVGGSSSNGGSSSAGGSQVWVWVFQNWQTSLSTIASHAASFTHVSPSLYEINYDYTQGVPQFAFGNVDDFGGLTSQQICQQVQAAGLKCVPLIFGGADNSGTDQGIQNILNNSSNAQTNFIAALISEGKAKGYDGWNLDWEVGNGTGYSGYGTELIGFLSALRQQLNQNGMILSTDIINNMMKQSYCSGGQGLIDLTQIGQVVDSVIDENYQPAIWTGSGPTPAACPASLANPLPCQEDVVTDLELLCVYVQPGSAVNVGLISPDQNAIAGLAFTAVESFGFRSISLWPNDNPLLDSTGFSPNWSNWLNQAQLFLGQK